MHPLVINLQKCSIHDGPGIRTTVFFKGCPLKCTWCHNPESQSFHKEVLYDEEKCSSCKACIKVCPEGAIYNDDDRIRLDRSKCIQCETCLDFCINNAREIVGGEHSKRDLIKEIAKDEIFYEESGGGVTFSGGEIMSQDIDYITSLMKQCKDKGIHVAVDTCGYASFDRYEKVLPYVDLFLYDIKIMDELKHKKFTGKGNKLILDNLKKLSDLGANLNVRIPLINDVNVDDENNEVMEIIEFLKPLRISMVNLLPYHSIGSHKYEKIDMEYQGEDFSRPTDEKLEEIKNLFISNNINAKIGG